MVVAVRRHRPHAHGHGPLPSAALPRPDGSSPVSGTVWPGLALRYSQSQTSGESLGLYEQDVISQANLRRSSLTVLDLNGRPGGISSTEGVGCFFGFVVMPLRGPQAITESAMKRSGSFGVPSPAGHVPRHPQPSWGCGEESDLMALRTRWWLPATTATAAVLLGAATPLASAAGEPSANDGAPFIFEDHSYPGSDQVLAETGAKLIRGDGNIRYTSCDGPYQIKVWAGISSCPKSGCVSPRVAPAS